MSWIYYLGVAIMVICAIRGWKKGFVKMLGEIAASILTFLFVVCLRTWVFESMLVNFLTGNSVLLARIVVCLVTYLILFLLLKTIITSLGILSKMPIIRGLNHLLGVVAGAAYGVLLVGILYMFYTWFFQS